METFCTENKELKNKTKRAYIYIVKHVRDSHDRKIAHHSGRSVYLLVVVVFVC